MWLRPEGVGWQLGVHLFEAFFKFKTILRMKLRSWCALCQKRGEGSEWSQYDDGVSVMMVSIWLAGCPEALYGFSLENAYLYSLLKIKPLAGSWAISSQGFICASSAAPIKPRVRSLRTSLMQTISPALSASSRPTRRTPIPSQRSSVRFWLQAMTSMAKACAYFATRAPRLPSGHDVEKDTEPKQDWSMYLAAHLTDISILKNPKLHRHTIRLSKRKLKL